MVGVLLKLKKRQRLLPRVLVVERIRKRRRTEVKEKEIVSPHHYLHKLLGVSETLAVDIIASMKKKGAEKEKIEKYENILAKWKADLPQMIRMKKLKLLLVPLIVFKLMNLGKKFLLNTFRLTIMKLLRKLKKKLYKLISNWFLPENNLWLKLWKKLV